MQRKSEAHRSIIVEGNDLPNLIVYNFEIKDLLGRANYFGRELKHLIIFLGLSLLLLIGISLLPQSPTLN